MQNSSRRVWGVLGMVSLATHAIAQYPFVESVIEYAPVNPPAGFTDPSRVLGPPSAGGMLEPDNSGIVSLGSQGGSITVRFDPPIENHPDNPMGLDFIVYGNAFFVGGDPQRRFQEPAIIEVAVDDNGNGQPDGPWYLIPGSRGFSPTPFPFRNEPPGTTNLPPNDIGLMAGAILNPNAQDGNPATDALEFNWGYADMTPTAEEFLDNRVRPSDPFTVGITQGSGGGDAFDISWAVDANGQPANLERIHFIRITSFIDRQLGVFGPASPEIDAIVAVARDIDSDGDGILDDYEIFVLGTDPLRPESTLLPLEIPASLGGSPAGTLLGTAEDARGNRIRLFSSGPRTNTGRARSVTVDIVPQATPGATLPDPEWVLSPTAWAFEAGVPDFVAAGIAPAEYRIAYTDADIAGLDEAQIQPYRLEGGALTQSAITDIQVNTGARRVTLRSAVPGVFVLAGPPGLSEPEPPMGPVGTITLSADPPGSTVADPANTLVITSDAIRDADDAIVADDTLVTVTASRGSITTPDADLTMPGVQVGTIDGRITFAVQAPPVAGGALFTAVSVEGSASGDLTYNFVPGPPAPPLVFSAVGWGGFPTREVLLRSSLVIDAFGNRVADGTLVTLALDGAEVIAPPDASATLPGYQGVVINGHITVTVAVPYDAGFGLTVTGPNGTPLGAQSFAPDDYPPVPIGPFSWLAAAALTILGLRRALSRPEGVAASRP